MSHSASATASLNDANHQPRQGARWALLLWLVLCVCGGAILGVLSAGGDSPWYQALSKPSWTPPSRVFAPVWTGLYAMMGVAAWRVWRRGGWPAHGAALNLFLVQLTLNFAWSPLFFGLQRIGVALLDIAALWLLIVATIAVFARIERGAAFLLAPYLAWVSYATALNWSIFAMN